MTLWEGIRVPRIQNAVKSSSSDYGAVRCIVGPKNNSSLPGTRPESGKGTEAGDPAALKGFSPKAEERLTENHRGIRGKAGKRDAGLNKTENPPERQRAKTEKKSHERITSVRETESCAGIKTAAGQSAGAIEKQGRSSNNNTDTDPMFS